MSHFLIGDENFEFRSFGTFPLLEHVLGVGRMFCAPRFELVDEDGEPFEDEDAFLTELGDTAPELWLPLADDLVALPSAADLDLILGHLLRTLRSADTHVRALGDPDVEDARVRWAVPFVWELRQNEWPALLAAVNAVLPEENRLTLALLQAHDADGLQERLNGLVDSQPETHAFGLAALAFAVARGTRVFTVEDDPVFYTFDENAAPPRFMERLDSAVLAEPEEARIEQIRAHVEATLVALDEERPEDALVSARQARSWTWGVADNAETARAYRASATAWLEARELDRAVADASFALHLEADADAYDTRAIALHVAGDIEDALADYTRALELSPDDARVLSNRAEAHYDMGDDASCIADAERSITLASDDPSPHVFRGRALVRLGRIGEARADAEKAAALGDESLLAELGRYEG
jgi:tetratricopeptide (TPR) repeat protein